MTGEGGGSKDGENGHRVVPLSPERLLDAAAEPIVVVDEAGIIRLVNRHAESSFGYPRDELRCCHLSLVLPEFGGEPRTWSSASAAAGDGSWDCRTRVARHRDGTQFPVRVAFSNVVAEGAVLTAATVRDMRSEAVSDARDPAVALSFREVEILRLMASGQSNKHIAQVLQLSVNTVRNHVQRILQKLDAHSKLEAVAIALRRGAIAVRDDGDAS